MKRCVVVVPHTHWDREWYAPFETYRVRLVSMMDHLIELLESGGLEYFHLDGQVAVLDDYLDARPEAAPSVASLVGAGRLTIGPWYVLMDEFCVSAETILNNLERGLARGAQIGATDFVGYLPDMFGHVAQMPQILRAAGIGHAVVWRGVPATVVSTSFAWEAPDGSRVRAEYLPVGYASGAFLPKEADAFLRRLAAHETEIGAFIGPTGPMLVMNGGDHLEAQAWVPDLVREVNDRQDRYSVRVSALGPYLAGRPEPPGAPWSGELRSGARAPILMGVLSNRVDIKQAAARAEAVMEKQAEPLATLWLPPGLWPADLLERAWQQMILNSAHDSIGACSADPVGRAVMSRYDSAVALGAAVVDQATAIAGVATASPGTVVVNPLGFDRHGLVELDAPGSPAGPGTQAVSVIPASIFQRQGHGADLGRLLGELADAGALGPSGRPVRVELSPPGAALVVTLVADATQPPDPRTAAVMAEAWARAGAGRTEPLTVRVERAASQRLLAHVSAVPGWGWALLQPSEPPSGPVTVSADGEVDNGLLCLRVDRDGLIEVAGAAGRVSGLNRITEEPDEGDTYNFSPSPQGRPARDQPDEVGVELVESGPLRAVLRVSRRFRWSSPAEAPVDVYSVVEVRAGDPIVRIETWFDHSGRDHRIRAVFPLPRTAASTRAECALTVVERTGAEGGPQEPALATFPSRRFVSAGGLTVFHSGLLEYELTGAGTALALTLLRAVGVLSRPAPPARPNPAGPALPLEDTQLAGRRRFAYAIGIGVEDPWATADELAAPLLVVPAEGGGPLADRGRRLAVDLGGAKVSALRRRQGRIEIRLFNPGPAPVNIDLPGQTGALVDLRGRPVSRWEDRLTLEPERFVTARLDRVDLDG